MRNNSARLDAMRNECNDSIDKMYVQTQRHILDGFKYVSKANAASVRTIESKLSVLKTATTVGEVLAVDVLISRS